MGSIALRRLARRVAREQGGFALAELLVSMICFAFVMTAILALLETSARVVPSDQERSLAIRESQAGLNGMVRELRQAYEVVGTSPSSMRVKVRLKKDDPATAAVETHSNWLVEYDCGVSVSGKCVRKEARPGQLPPATGPVVIARVSNPADHPVFSFETDTDSVNPVYVKVRVEVPASGERSHGYTHKIVLEDGFFARNMRLGI
jgi:type II secretory pathway pseudopilin PulG